MEKLNVYQKLTKARNMLLEQELKKSATNNFAKFKYMELTDIIPATEKICEEVGITIITSFNDELATTKVINHDNIEEVIEFTSPFNTNLETGQIKGAQKIGALHTYFRRYMLMLVFEIMEHDAIDGADNTKPTKKANSKNAAPKQVDLELEAIKNEFIKLNKENGFNAEEIKNISQGLKLNEVNLEQMQGIKQRALDILTSREL
jgi:hypothetical protein